MNKNDEIKNDWQRLDMKRDMRKHVGDAAQRHYRRFPLDMSKHYKELEKPGAYVDYISDEMPTSDNTWKNESKNMNKKLIKLTESDLHRIVKESVNRILKEGGYIGHDRADDEDMYIERQKDTQLGMQQEFEMMKKKFPNRPPLWYTEHFDDYLQGFLR